MFIDLDNTTWLWIKALHIICFTAWMAGHFYLPRLYVYHAMAKEGSEVSETFKIMERRLIVIIMNPAMIATIFFGLILLANLEAEIWASVWLWIKLVCIVGLLVMHFLGIKWRKEFFEGRNTHSHKYYRIVNEIPSLLMIILVIFSVVKPF